MNPADRDQVRIVIGVVVVEVGNVLKIVGIDVSVGGDFVWQYVVGEFFDFYFITVLV